MAKLVRLEQIDPRGKKLVLATGCFDILHSAHREFFKKAKKAGDILAVGLESDKRVRKLKGKGRPVFRLAKRATNLTDIPEIDYIFALPENLDSRSGAEDFISRLKPDILAVSAHTSYIDIKKQIVEKYGGKLKIVTPYIPGYSTTKILEDIG